MIEITLPLPPVLLKPDAAGRDKAALSAARLAYQEEIREALLSAAYGQCADLGRAVELRVIGYIAAVRPSDGKYRPHDASNLLSAVAPHVLSTLRELEMLDPLGICSVAAAAIDRVDRADAEGVRVVISGA